MGNKGIGYGPQGDGFAVEVSRDHGGAHGGQ